MRVCVCVCVCVCVDTRNIACTQIKIAGICTKRNVVNYRNLQARHSTACKYRVAKTHRIPYLHRSFSAKVTYI